MSDVLDALHKKARDHGRVPMQWNSAPHAGFTTGTPWMRVNDDYKTWNVSGQINDPDSVLRFWKHALQLRKNNEVLIYGDFEAIYPEDEQVFAYTRSLGDSIALVLLNFTLSEVSFSLPGTKDYTKFTLSFGNYEVEEERLSTQPVALRGYEGRVYFSRH